ncbi:MAG TPA: hypothetical protein VGM52_17025 [Herbaspirillum sp.]
MVELDDAGLEAAVAIAVMTWQMLRGLGPKNISPENLRKAIFQSFDYSDALPGPKRADQLRNTFEQAISEGVRKHLRITTATIVRFITPGRDLIRNPIQSLAAIYAVFGSFKNYSKCVASGKANARYQLSYVHRPRIQTLPLRKPDPKPMKKAEFFSWVRSLAPRVFKALLNSSREWMRDLKYRRPEITRKIFHHRMGKTVPLRLLRWFDRDWLEQQFDETDKGPPRWGIEMVNINDIAKQVRELGKHLKATKPHWKVHPSSLRGDIPLSSFQRLMQKSSVLRKAVEAVIDNDKTWRERTTMHLCEVAKKYNPQFRWAKRGTYDKATFEEFCVMVTSASTWIKKKKRLEHKE